MKFEHIWVQSTLGHGILMCKDCSITLLEAGVLRVFKCPSSSKETREKKDD